MNRDGYSHEVLMKEAMNTLEKLAGEAWTDFNIHDPGITILEYLASALHDVSFRISLPIAEHVASVFGKDGLRRHLPLPDNHLQCRPITDDDLRALLIDLPYVRNAWIDHGEAGLRELIIDHIENLTANQKVWLRQAAREIFIRYRVVGTDIKAIRFIRPKPIQIRLSVNIPAYCDPDVIAKQIVLILEKHIRRIPQFDSSSVSNPIVPTGPPLTNGQLSQATLLNSRRSSRLEISPIREEIEAIADGVFLQNINLTRSDNIHSGLDGLSLDPKNTYELDIDNLAITIRENGLAKTIDLSGARKWLEFHRDQHSQEKHMTYPNQPAEGKTRTDLIDHTSIQKHFPSIYCLTRGSIPRSNDKGMIAKAKQLQGFIMLLEQFISIAFNRMKGSTALLNLNSAKLAFNAGEIPGLSLHKGMDNSDKALSLKAQELLLKADETKLALNQIEQFTLSLYGESGTYINKNDIHNKGIKCFEGWNYNCAAGDSSRLTWIERTVADAFINTDSGDTEFAISINDFREGSHRKYQISMLNIMGKEILQSTMNYESYDQADNAAEKLLRHAASRHRYSIQSHRSEKGETYFKLCLSSRDGQEIIAVSQTKYTHISNAEIDRDSLIECVTRSLKKRGIYMIDHILLRPANKNLPPACQHQITFILPTDKENWNSDFSKDAIIRIFDELIPAHLLTNVVWLDNAEMSKFDEIYGAWQDEFWGGGPSLEITRQTVVTFLEDAGISGWTFSDAENDNKGAQYESRN